MFRGFHFFFCCRCPQLFVSNARLPADLSAECALFCAPSCPTSCPAEALILFVHRAVLSLLLRIRHNRQRTKTISLLMARPDKNTLPPACPSRLSICRTVAHGSVVDTGLLQHCVTGHCSSHGGGYYRLSIGLLQAAVPSPLLTPSCSPCPARSILSRSFPNIVHVFLSIKLALPASFFFVFFFFFFSFFCFGGEGGGDEPFVFSSTVLSFQDILRSSPRGSSPDETFRAVGYDH